MIAVKDLTKKFDSTVALDKISFSINNGSVFGLVGSNGAGKSTFLRTLAGIYKPDSGEVLLDEISPFENSEAKSKLFFISDYPYFIPQYTLSDMANFYARIYPNWSQKRFEELCSLFTLNSKSKISTMSKGMQRQSAIICALATMPKYLLLDEVFDGLDPVMRQLLKKIISGEVSERDMTVIIASHNLRELEDLCDHVGLFHKGGVIFDRDLDELKLGINKVQAVFKPMPALSSFEPLDIVKTEIRGSLINLVVRGTKEEILNKINELNPIFAEVLPLTLEEVFISEMEVAGYDLDNILN